MKVDGLSETQGMFTAIARELEHTQAFDNAVHRGLVEGYKAVSSQIPKDTGALGKSLTRYNDRAQHFTPTADGYDFGSTLPQAKYQSRRIPDPEDGPLMELLGGAVDLVIERAGGGGEQ